MSVILQWREREDRKRQEGDNPTTEGAPGLHSASAQILIHLVMILRRKQSWLQQCAKTLPFPARQGDETRITFLIRSWFLSLPLHISSLKPSNILERFFSHKLLFTNESVFAFLLSRMPWWWLHYSACTERLCWEQTHWCQITLIVTPTRQLLLVIYSSNSYSQHLRASTCSPVFSDIGRWCVCWCWTAPKSCELLQPDSLFSSFSQPWAPTETLRAICLPLIPLIYQREPWGSKVGSLTNPPKLLGGSVVRRVLMHPRVPAISSRGGDGDPSYACAATDPI